MAADGDGPQLAYPAPLDDARGAAFETTDGDGTGIETPVLVVGGGPVGMLQSLMLARLHGQACTLIEREPTTTPFPKMEYTNGRSMEIYRMLGLHDEVRAVGTAQVAEHYSNDEIIVTSLAEGGKLVHVWERDGSQALREKGRETNDGSQYLEPHMRCHQIVIEKFLKDKVEAEPLIKSYWSTAFVSLTEDGDQVVSQVKKPDGSTQRIRSQYVIGCDGGGSWVRKSVNLESKREYLNMTMAFVHFRSAALRSMFPFQRAWHTTIIGGGLLVSQNEADVWTVHFMVPPGVDPASLTVDDILTLTYGGCQGRVSVPSDHIYCRGVWRVDVAIANKFRSDIGRVFLAGDAAHQLSPVGGHGLNSGLGDAFDLAWKLSATLKGWAGKDLLDTYDIERRAIAFENLGHVQDGLGPIRQILEAHITYGAETMSREGPDSEAARKTISEVCDSVSWLHDQNGNILGATYKQSPIILTQSERSERPKGSDRIYLPTTYPGSRAPHVWMSDGRSTIDLLSTNSFNLVDFSEDGSLNQPFVRAAERLSLPLKVLRWRVDKDAQVRKIYERDLILVRPDTYVAWRCSKNSSRPLSHDDASRILLIALGNTEALPHHVAS